VGTNNIKMTDTYLVTNLDLYRDN